MRDEVAIIGLDVSLNGCGIILQDFRDDRVLMGCFITMVKKQSDLVDEIFNIKGHYLQPKQGGTKKRLPEPNELFNSRRRDFVSGKVIEFIERVCLSINVFVCIEDYAYDSQSTGLLEMAEISGIVRNYLWNKCIPYRLYAPTTVKMFGAGNGFAKKIHMRISAEEQGFTLSDDFFSKGNKFQFPISVGEKLCTHDYVGPGTDLVDGFHIATLGRTELLLREGQVKLENLTVSEKKVFTKVSKKHPISVLDRKFIIESNCEMSSGICDRFYDTETESYGESNQAR